MSTIHTYFDNLQGLLARTLNTQHQAMEAAAKLFDELTDVLGIVYNRQQDNLDDEIEALIEERQQARKSKNFARADEIRDELAAKGILLKDTREGVKWTRA